MTSGRYRAMRSVISNRKGDMTINTIIVAAIGLLVLVVLIAIFTGRLGGFQQAIDVQQGAQSQCTSVCAARNFQTATLKDAASGCASEETLMIGSYRVGTNDKVCCCKTPKTA